MTITFNNNNNNYPNNGSSSSSSWNFDHFFAGREKEIKRLDEIVNDIQTKQQQQSTTISQSDDESSSSSESSSSPSSSTTSPLVVLHGVAGSGKSSLIEYGYKWSTKGWLLAKGKFEQQRKSQPYSAVIQALDDLVDQWSTYNNTHASVCQMKGFHKLLEEDIEYLQNIIPKAFDVSGRCTFTCPSINSKKKKKMKNIEVKENIMNKSSTTTNTTTTTPPPPVKSSTTTSIDFSSVESVNAAFRRIICFLCTARPVCLFLDDAHWADRSSLQVIKALLSYGDEPIPGFLLAVSYRDEEINNNLPLSSLLDELLEEQGSGSNHHQVVTVHSMAITNLNVNDVAHVVATITNHSNDDNKKVQNEILALANVIHNKTAGNPFFVVQFIQMLRDEGFLKFSALQYKWEWGDIEKLQEFAKVSDNVADIVASKLQKLPETTQVALKVSSCLGKVIPLDVLIKYFEEYYEEHSSGHTCSHSLHNKNTTTQKSMIALQNVLEYAVKNGILFRYNNNQQQQHGSGELSSDSNTTSPEKEEGQEEQVVCTFMWSHDKLQHVAYSLIPESLRPSLHLRLGKLLWKMSIEYPDSEWMIFMAADQLNKGTNDGNCPTCLGREAAQLNLHAAQLSLEKSALFPALDMLQAGITNIEINTNRWDDDYELCLELYSLLGEVCVQLGQYDDAMHCVREIENNARCLDDKFRGQCVMLKCTTSGKDRDFELGTTKALEVLKLYGEKLPHKLLPGQLYLENQRLKSKLPGGKLEGIMDLPAMTDERSSKITKLLLRYLAISAAQTGGGGKGSFSLGAFAIIRALNIICSKGLCCDAPMGVLLFATLLRKDGHYEEACEYGDFALRLVDQMPQRLGSLHGNIRTLTNSAIYPCLRPFHSTMDGLLEGYKIGLKTGEIEKASSGIIAYFFHYLCIGLPLEPILSDIVSYGREARQLNVPITIMSVFRIFRQSILNLINESKSSDRDPTLLKGKAMDQAEELSKLEGNGARMTSRDINTFRLMLACIYNKWDTAEEMLEILEPYLSFDGFIARYHIRLTYVGLASLVVSRRSGKKKHRNIAKKVIKIFKSEVKRGSVNAHPVLEMLGAEESPSKERYEHAIRICARLGLIHHGAYLCERAALYFLEEENDKGWGEYFLAQACALYVDWGANGKVQAMRKEYGELLEEADHSTSKRSSALKGRSRYSAKQSESISEIPWSSFSTGSSTTDMAAMRSSAMEKSSFRTSVTSSSSEDGKSDGDEVVSGTFLPLDLQ